MKDSQYPSDLGALLCKRLEAAARPHEGKKLPHFPRSPLGGEVKVRGEVHWKEVE